MIESANAIGHCLSVLAMFIKKHASILVPAAAITGACVLVMALTRPKTNREIVCALIATFSGGIFGPSAVILFFDIKMATVSTMDQDYVRNLLTIICGLPGWVIVRAWFNWSEVNRKKTLVDLIEQIKELWK